MLHKIRSRAYLTGNDSVLAVADVNIDDAVIIRDCRLLKVRTVTSKHSYRKSKTKTEHTHRQYS